MKLFISSIVIASLLICVSAKAEQLKIDHAIVAVLNLENAIASFKEMGFTIKPGRLHKNGLQNSHIKFSDKTELELMSVTKEPTDTISSAYYSFLESGEGGAFLALSGIPIHVVKTRLKKNNIKHTVILGRLWDYVVFPEGSGIDHLFFIEKHRTFTDKNWVYKHDNGIASIRKIWIEGDNRLEKLLKILGAHRCANISTKEATGEVYSVNNAEIIIVPTNNRNTRLRFKGISFDKSLTDSPKNLPNKHGIFIKPPTNNLCGNQS